MTNAKISAKGKLLLTKKAAARLISKALATKSNELYKEEGLKVSIQGKSVVIRGVSSLSAKEIEQYIAAKTS